MILPEAEMTKEQQEFLAERLLGWKPGQKCGGGPDDYGYCDEGCGYNVVPSGTYPGFRGHDIPCPNVLTAENTVTMIEAARRSVHIVPYGESDWSARAAVREWHIATTLSEAIALALYDALPDGTE